MANLPPVPPEKKKSGLGCLGCGCLILILLIVLFFGGTGAIVLVAYKAVYSLTSDTAEVVGNGDKGPDVYQQTRDKITAYSNDIAQNKSSSLHLNTDEINTLIAESPELTNLRGGLYVIVEGDLVTLQMSLPISGIPGHFLEGRYFNGTIIGNLTIEDGKISVHLSQLEVAGKTYSGSDLDSIQNIDWDSILRGNPQVNSWLANVKSLKIENNEIVIEN